MYDGLMVILKHLKRLKCGSVVTLLWLKLKESNRHIPLSSKVVFLSEESHGGEVMINSAQKDRVIAVLKKYGLEPQAMAKDMYMMKDGSNIAADLRERAYRGVWITNEVQTTHGVLESGHRE